MEHPARRSHGRWLHTIDSQRIWCFHFQESICHAVRNWGLNDLHKHIRKAYKLYDKFHEEIEKDCTDEEFMALFEKMPQFDDFDDEFIETEEKWTSEIAHYIDEHIENFATIA